MANTLDLNVGFRRLAQAAVAALAIGTLFSAERAAAQDVVLNPELVQGTVRIGVEPLGDVFIRATSGSFQASERFYSNPGDPTVINYSLTVDAPLTGDRTYAVQACLATMQDTFDAFCFAPIDVVVTDNNIPSVQDFVIDDPAFIQGTVSVSGGVETVSSAILYGHYSDPRGAFCHTGVSPCFKAQTNASRGGAYRIAVPHGVGIEIFPNIQLQSGVTLFPPTIPSFTVDLLPGEEKTVDIVIDPPGGKVVGTITHTGPEIADNHRVWVLGTAQKTASIAGDGPYEVTGLPDGTNYTVTVDSYFSDGRFYRFPNAALSPTKFPDIIGGSTETVDASVEQSAIKGILVPAGSATLADLTSGTLNAYGASASSSGGLIRDQIDIATGAYDFVASEGTWRDNFYSLRFGRENATDPSNNFLENLSIFLFPPFAPEVTVVTGETAVHDIAIPMGKVTVNFSVLGGGLLSRPTLRISCGQVDELGQTMSSFNGYSTNLSQIDVPLGTVGFLAPEGACTVTAQATVNGTFTSFGQVSVEVVPGIDQAIDLLGPVLSNIFPEPNLNVGTNTIVVTGDATDDVGVTGVAVNGLAATLTPGVDPADPNKVGFASPSLALVPGPNSLAIVATDISGNTADQTRTVCFDTGAPTVAWSPADGFATGSSPVEVAGTATDDAGISSITVDGTAVFTAVDPSTAPTGQAFSAYVDLVLDQATGIEVVVTDICGRQTAETRFVTLVGNSPPVATDIGVSTDADTPAAVTLAATDPDNNPLTYTIVGQPVNGTLSGVAPNLTYTPNMNYAGADSFTYKATDDGLLSSNTATVSITVNAVNTAPVANAGVDIVQACSAATGASVTLDASGSSDINGDVLVDTWTGTFPEGTGTAVGEMATVTMPIGSSDVLLTVDDGALQVTDTVNVLVTAQATGLQAPLAALVPEGDLPPMPNHAFKHGRTLPLRFGLLCGSTVLTDADVAPPQIAAIVSEGGTPADLTVIDPDSGEANDGGILFRYSVSGGIWVYNLNTATLPNDTAYIITILMPDGRRFDAKFAFK